MGVVVEFACAACRERWVLDAAADRLLGCPACRSVQLLSEGWACRRCGAPLKDALTGLGEGARRRKRRFLGLPRMMWRLLFPPAFVCPSCGSRSFREDRARAGLPSAGRPEKAGAQPRNRSHEGGSGE